jgi:hypothetical protein
MAFHNGNTLKMLALIEELGAVTSIDLFTACGVATKNQPGLLGRYIDDGTIATELVTAPGRRVRRYIWQKGAVMPAPTFASTVTNTTPKPHERGMRICLGPLCNGQQSFMSNSAANRICPRCKATAEHVASRCGLFDTPHVVLNP